jgi:hypothetical protein
MKADPWGGELVLDAPFGFVELEGPVKRNGVTEPALGRADGRRGYVGTNGWRRRL